MKKLTLSLIVMTGLMLMMIGSVSATTLEEGAIIAAADRLVETQNTNGGWEWTNPETNPDTGTSSVNTFGVTAQGLLDAYELTGNTAYLDAAKLSGDWLIVRFNTPQLIIDNRINAFDIIFLYDLGRISDVSAYTDKAADLLLGTLTGDNFWAHNYGKFCSNETGCTAQDMFDAIDNRRGGESGIILWDLAPWVTAANLGEQTSWADDLKILMDDEYAYLETGDYYTIGLSGVISATGNLSAVEALIGEQLGDGSWTSVQDTAYAIMALVNAEEMTSANWGKNWLVNNQETNGGWIGSSDVENTEVDSEALQAIFDVIAVSNVGGVGADFVALTVPDSIDYGNLFSTPGYETVAQEILLTNVGSLGIVVTPIWESGAEVFKHIKFSDTETGTYDKITDGVGTGDSYTTTIGATWISGTTFATVKDIWTKIKVAVGLAKLEGPQSGTIYFQAVEA